MGRKSSKTYRSGDQIHIAVTQNFERTATDFFDFCNENHYNPSEVIRSCMEQWLQRQIKLRELMEEGIERDPRDYIARERRILQRLKEEGVS